MYVEWFKRGLLGFNLYLIYFLSDSESEIRLVMSFLATDSLITTEYKIYSFVSVLSAIGGTMSMFLGWSLYKSFDDITNSLSKIFQSRNIIMVKS